jgi:hypothetical protein
LTAGAPTFDLLCVGQTGSDPHRHLVRPSRYPGSWGRGDRPGGSVRVAQEREGSTCVTVDSNGIALPERKIPGPDDAGPGSHSTLCISYRCMLIVVGSLVTLSMTVAKA